MSTPPIEQQRPMSQSAGETSATDQAKATAQDTGGAAKEQAQQAAGQAKGALRSQVDQRSTQAGEQIGGMASDVSSVGDQLREQGKDRPAKLAEQAADWAEQLGSYLRDNDADRIVGDVEDFGRRQPWAIIAGGVALGFVASRFLKASSTRRYEQRDQLPVRSQRVPTYTEPPVKPSTAGRLDARVTTGLADTPATGLPGSVERTV